MDTDEAIPIVRRKYHTLSSIMDERMRRRWAASEAIALGWGGITAVAEATGLSQTTIRAGIADCRTPEAAPVHPGHVVVHSGPLQLLADVRNTGPEWMSLTPRTSSGSGTS
jgi:hypothetical protein